MIGIRMRRRITRIIAIVIARALMNFKAIKKCNNRIIAAK
jgi:hypothetical protein